MICKLCKDSVRGFRCYKSDHIYRDDENSYSFYTADNLDVKCGLIILKNENKSMFVSFEMNKLFNLHFNYKLPLPNSLDEFNSLINKVLLLR